MTPTTSEPITGVVLAGGRARRMGGTDKGLVQLNGRPLIAYAIDALLSVTDRVIINANRSQAAYQALGHRVVSDRTNAFDGPLAGILSTMAAADTRFILTVPCDCPLIRGDHLQRMIDALATQPGDGSVAFDGTRLHPVFLLLDCCLTDSLDTYLASGERKIEPWLNRHTIIRVDFSDQPEVFRNINTADELAALQNTT